MTEKDQQELAVAVVRKAMARGYFPYPLKDKERYDGIKYQWGVICVYVGQKYKRVKNDTSCHLVPIKDVIYDHSFAKAYFGFMWQEALKAMVLMETTEQRLYYIKKFM